MAEYAEAMRLVELTCARLCHDLSSLVGSLNGALELVADDWPTTDEAFALARQAARELMWRLRLLRAAWGEGGPELPLAGLRDLSAGLIGAHRLTLDLTGLPDDAVFVPPMARAVLNVLLLANESLPAAGQIWFTGAPTDLYVSIAGPGAAWPAGLPLCLVDPAAAMAAFSNPRSIQMPLTALLARGLGLRLSVLMAAGSGGPPPLRLSVS